MSPLLEWSRFTCFCPPGSCSAREPEPDTLFSCVTDMTPLSHSGTSLPALVITASQISRLALWPWAPLFPPPVQAMTTAAPSGPVPPLGPLYTYTGRATPQTPQPPLSLPRKPPPPVPYSSRGHHFIMSGNYCSFVAFFFFFFCHPLQPPVPATIPLSEAFVSLSPLHIPAWLMQQPWMELPPIPPLPPPLPLRHWLKLPQTPSASCLTSPKPPFIPFRPVWISLGDRSHDAIELGLWVLFPPCHFFATWSGQVAIPL